MTAKRITTAIFKGGTGKTATATNLAAALADQGEDVLAVDLDHRGGLTKGLGLEDAYDAEYHIGQFLLQDDAVDGADPTSIIRDRGPFDVIPANRRMDDLSDDLNNDRAWFLRLEEFLDDVEDGYDWVVLDSPPELNRVSDSAIIAAKNVLVPLMPAGEALDGFSELMENQVIPIRRDLDDEVSIAGIFVNVARDNNEKKFILEELRPEFDDELLLQESDDGEEVLEVRYRVAIPRSWRHGETLFEFDPENAMCDRYRKLAATLDERIDGA
ncbi:ParA family protein [Natronoarchaeum philippinense]|nr:ParA family protein [Natronoarchaeum philippinense]